MAFIIIKNLDNNESIDLTDNFLYDNNSITSGKIDLESYFKTDVSYSWDNANNPSEQEIRLISTTMKIFNCLILIISPIHLQTKQNLLLKYPWKRKFQLMFIPLVGKKLKILEVKHTNPVFILFYGMEKMNTENYYQMESMYIKS